MTEDALDVLEQLFVAGVAITARALTRGGGQDLTFPQWRVLVVLGAARDGATVSEVASRVGVTIPATSRQLRRLARRGLVVIEPDTEDRRATRARETVLGETVRRRIIEFRLDEMRRVIEGVPLPDDYVARTRRVAQAFEAFV